MSKKKLENALTNIIWRLHKNIDSVTNQTYRNSNYFWFGIMAVFNLVLGYESCVTNTNNEKELSNRLMLSYYYNFWPEFSFSYVVFYMKSSVFIKKATTVAVNATFSELQKY